MLNDIRYAVRTFRREPGFTASVLVTLALGVGASTAMFSVLNAVLLRPLPQANAERVVRIYQPNDASQTTGFSPLEIADLRARTGGTIDDVVEYHSMPFTFIGAGDGEAQRLQTGVVSPSYFTAMGLSPVLGRTFVPADAEPGAAAVLLLSHGYWQREFAGDAGVLGRTLQMNDRTHTVVGVLPPFPQFPDRNDVFMPVSSCPFRAAPAWAENRRARGLAVFALLHTSSSAEAALHELRAVSARLQQEHPDAYTPDVRYDVTLVPLRTLMALPAQATAVILLIATLLLLGIVCSNYGNLLLVRTLRRDTDIAVRLALGAGRMRIARQLVLESALLAAAGGALGIAVAYGASGALASFVTRFTPLGYEVGLDATVLLFAFAAIATTTLIAALLPLGVVRSSLGTRIRQGSGRTGGARAHARVRNALIVIQVAVSLVLAAGAGALVSTLVELEATEMGFDPAPVTTARLDLNWSRYDASERVYDFYRELEHRLTRMPGIEAAGLGSSFPLNGDPLNAVSFAVQHEFELAGAHSVAALTASPGYFDALGVPLLRGRRFTASDERDDIAPVAIITRSLARRYWSGGEAIGGRISLDGGDNWITIVGIVGDLRHGLEADFDDLVFLPHSRFGGFASRLVVRATPGTDHAAALIRAAVASIDAQQPVTDVAPLERYRGERLAPHRLTALLLALFAVIALATTAVGLGGSTAFSVAQRTREIGIRVALGARPAAVLKAVLGQTAALAALGVLIGVVGSWFALRQLRAGIPVARTGDALALAIVATIVIAVVSIAALLPARRATAIAPVHVLRDP